MGRKESNQTIQNNVHMMACVPSEDSDKPCHQPNGMCGQCRLK